MNVEFHEVAASELDDAISYYRVISRELSDQFRDEAELGVKRIAERPEAWQPLGQGLRRYLMGRFPYGIVFRVQGADIKIYAVMHLKRRPGYWRKRLKSTAP